MQHKAQFVRSLRWLASARLVGQMLSWLGTIWVMRLLAPGDYALVAICTAVLTLASLVAELGFGSAIVQAKTVDREEARSIFGAAIAFAALCTGLLVAAAPSLAQFYSAPEAEPMMQVSALTLVFGALATVPDANLRREMAFARISILELVASVTAITVTLTLALVGAGAWSLIVGPVLGSAIRAVLLHILWPNRLWPSSDFRRARKLLRYGLTVALSRMATFVFGQADVMIGARILSKPALGEYSIAMHLAMLPMSKLMGMVNSVAFPAIASLNRTEALAPQVLLSSVRILGHIVVPTLWGLAAIAPWLVPVVLGPVWAGAVLPLQVVCVVLPLRLLSVLMSTALQGLGHAGIELRNTLTGVVVFPLLFLAGAYFGAIGLASAWVVGLPLVVVLNLRRAAPVLGFSIAGVTRAMSRPTLVAGALATFIWAMCAAAGNFANSIPGVVAISALAGACYMALLWFVDRSSATQLLGFFTGTKRG
jgi:teichuronic acid exporter